MSIDWLAVRAEPIRAVEHGVSEVDAIDTTYVGPVTTDRLDYPAGEVLPQSTTRSDGNEFTHTIYANLYFDRGPGMDYVEDVLHPVAWAVVEVLDALAETESVVSYVPQTIEDFAGELDNTLVLLVAIQFEVTTLVDLAETAP
jgi:hypothetical protein